MLRGAGWILAAIVLVVLGFATVPGLIHRQVLGLGATDIHDAASLPDHINVCGRDWHKDTLGRVLSGADIRARPGGGPPLVDPLPFARAHLGLVPSRLSIPRAQRWWWYASARMRTSAMSSVVGPEPSRLTA